MYRQTKNAILTRFSLIAVTVLASVARRSINGAAEERTNGVGAGER